MARSYTTRRYEGEADRQRQIAAKSSGSARRAALGRAAAADKAARTSAGIDAREERNSFRLIRGK